MTPDQAAAALSFATMLSEGLIPKAQPEALPEPSQTLQDAPGQEQTPELEVALPDTKIADLEAKFENLEKDIEQIKQALENKPKE